MCMADWSDGTMTPLREETRTARKSHRCNECNRVIDRGEQYKFEAFVYERQIWTYKTCVHCLAVRDWLWEHCGGFLFDMVKEDFLEHKDEQPGRAVLRAMVAMDRYQWRMNGKLMPVPELARGGKYVRST